VDLSELAQRVQAAVREAREPPPPGGSKPITFPTDHFDDRTWELLWEVIRLIRERDPGTFVQFSEWTLASLAIDALEADAGLDLQELTKWVAGHLDEFGRRVVSTPICHLQMDASAIRLADDAVLVRADVDRDAPDTDEDIVAGFNIEKWLGVRMSRPLRHVDLASAFDTTRTAALLTVEHGVPPLALARARARTQYAIALWTVLAPPEGRKVLPDLGGWVPQPSVHMPQRHRRVPGADESGRPTEDGGGINLYGAFEMPAEDVARLPFQAMAHVDRRGAQAVLSAGLHLLNASRASRLQPSERARALMAAVEALGEQPSGKGARARFRRLTERHGTDKAAEARGWSPARVRAAFDRIVKARNIATHGADAVLLDLGYPPDARRKMLYGTALGTELAAGGLQSDLPVLVHVVGRTLDQTIRELAADGWSDAAYDGYFK
jgi:hypothetical protein